MRLMSGRFREYAATMPAIDPATKSTTNSTAMNSARRILRMAVPRYYSRENAVDEASGVFGREALCQFYCFVDDDGPRRLGPVPQLERSHSQQQTIDRRQPFDGPALQQGRNCLVALLGMLERSQHEVFDEEAMRALAEGRQILLEHFGRVAMSDFNRKQRLQCELPGHPA